MSGLPIIFNSMNSRTRKPIITGVTLCGYAVRYGVLSHPRRDRQTGEPCRLRFRRGAFAGVEEQADEISICADHDELREATNSKAGTVRIQETDRGLWFWADLPDAGMARILAAKVRHGFAVEASISWHAGDVRRVRERGMLIVEHTRVRRLDDIAVVKRAAFPQTRVAIIEPSTPQSQARRLKLAKSTLSVY